jgi:hypothetical protein
MADLMMLVISSDRMAIAADLLEGARDELVPQPLEATPDAPVDQAVTDADDETAKQTGIDLDVERDAAAGGLLQPAVSSRTSSWVSSDADVAVAWVMP